MSGALRTRFHWALLGLAGGCVVVAVFVACATARGSAGAQAPCTFNHDCVEGLSCAVLDGERKCIKVHRVVEQTCVRDDECDEDQSCKAGRCGVRPTPLFQVLEEPCESDADCPEAKLCDLDNKRCQFSQSATVRCNTSWDCAAQEVCSFGTCERKSIFNECRSDFDCGGMNRCILGRCQ